MEKVRISHISYLNTVPFEYGISKSDFLKENSLISKDYPAECARKLQLGQADLGIVPIAAIPDFDEYQIVTNYCISCNGPVATVMLYSDVPLNEIENIILDYQSRTSVMLVKTLAEQFWNISPKWISAEKGYENDIKGKTAGLVIGDRCFALKNKFSYCTDLGNTWKNFTGLPFVFAVWIATKKIDKQYIDELNKAFASGTSNIQKMPDYKKHDILSDEEQIHYLSKNIEYMLDSDKKTAINLFFEKAKIQHKPVF